MLLLMSIQPSLPVNPPIEYRTLCCTDVGRPFILHYTQYSLMMMRQKHHPPKHIDMYSYWEQMWAWEEDRGSPLYCCMSFFGAKLKLKVLPSARPEYNDYLLD